MSQKDSGSSFLQTKQELGIKLELDVELQMAMDKMLSHAGTAFMPAADKRQARQQKNSLLRKMLYEKNIAENTILGQFGSIYMKEQIDQLVARVPLEQRRGRTILHEGGGRKYDAQYIPYAQKNQLHVQVRDISNVACAIMEKYFKAIKKKYGSDYAPWVHMDDIRNFPYLDDKEMILLIWLCRILGLLSQEDAKGDVKKYLLEVGKLYQQNEYLRVCGFQAFHEENPDVEQETMTVLSFQEDVYAPLCEGAGMELKVVDVEYFPYYHISDPPYYRKLCKAFTIVHP
jgi:hypothetical protein